LETRKATIQDLKDITEIYNEAIKNTTATFDTEQKTDEQMKEWFLDHGQNNPILVVLKDKQLVGWASLSKYSTRCAYSNTAELSIYISESYQGQGIGTTLLNDILRFGKKVGLHVVLARIAEDNEMSIRLLEKHGFFHVGILKEVGYKFGKILDVFLMQLIFDGDQ
jgi:phosphinothricin acetyltransferase